MHLCPVMHVPPTNVFEHEVHVQTLVLDKTPRAFQSMLALVLHSSALLIWSSS